MAESLKVRILQKLEGLSYIKQHRFISYKNLQSMIIYSDGLVDKGQIDHYVISPLTEETLLQVNVDNITKQTLKHCELTYSTDFDTIIKKLFDGDTLLFVASVPEIIVLSFKSFPLRAVSEPPTSTVLKGPREGFVEDLSINLTLLKRKLKTPDLKVDMIKMGRYTSTNIAICYIDSICDLKLLKQIKKRLSEIEIDGVLDSSYLRQFLESKGFSIFKQLGDTEKPDVLASKMLEGRYAIIVDGSPLVLTLPFLFLEDFLGSGDYYSVPYKGTLNRLVRLIAVGLAIMMPGIYVSAQLFHVQFLPLRFLLTIVSSIKGIPLSPSLEMLFVLLIFEILNEASIRMPKYVGMAMSVVGALVLGDTAVRAGIVSTPTILIMALSGIGVYTVPDQQSTLSMLRLVFLILSGSMGIIGLACGIIIVICYLNTLTSFGSPYLAPYAPFIKEDLDDGIFKAPVLEHTTRPKSIKNTNPTRVKEKK